MWLDFLKNDLKFLAYYTNTPISCGYKIHTFPTPRDLPDSFFPFQCFSQSCLRSHHLSQQQLSKTYLLSWASPPPALLSPNIPVPVQHETSPVPRPCSQLSACFFLLRFYLLFNAVRNSVLPQLQAVVLSGALQIHLAAHPLSPFSLAFPLQSRSPRFSQVSLPWSLWLLQHF